VSEKGLKIKTYYCTDIGVLYTLSKNPAANIIHVLDAHKNRSSVFNSFRKLYTVWGHETFARFLKNISDFFPMMQKEGIETAISFLLVKSMMDAKALDPKTRTKNAKAAMKEFPNAKRLVKEWSNNIKEVL
ncbi:MAG: hypothetical protein NWE95_02270, partial [Candidatus Bathyarchaeota archaeon]|nr:hypothetical protein [Candidatus Bathyarchaeota archaeon]